LSRPFEALDPFSDGVDDPSPLSLSLCEREVERSRDFPLSAMLLTKRDRFARVFRGKNRDHKANISPKIALFRVSTSSCKNEPKMVVIEPVEVREFVKNVRCSVARSERNGEAWRTECWERATSSHGIPEVTQFTLRNEIIGVHVTDLFYSSILGINCLPIKR
jgi:hypothetical protein